MAKIVLQQDGKSFTIITHEYSKWHLPCLGEDGELYCLFQARPNEFGDFRTDMDFLDKEQKLCIKTQYEVMHHKEPEGIKPILNWVKEIFDRVEGFEEYIEEWKKKHNQEW